MYTDVDNDHSPYLRAWCQISVWINVTVLYQFRIMSDRRHVVCLHPRYFGDVW